jgi:hypothetical protein
MKHRNEPDREGGSVTEPRPVGSGIKIQLLESTKTFPTEFEA